MGDIDGTIDDLADLRAAAEELDGEHEVPMGEMFPDDFMQEHTEFENVDQLFEESQWDVESQEDFRAIPDEPFDEYIAETTDFKDWDEMYSAAGGEWASRELGL